MAHRKPETDPTKAVAYSRTSTADQRNGIAAQDDAMRRFAKTQRLTIVATEVDCGVSGGERAAERPGFAAALHALREHRAGILLVAKRDRLARDVVEAAIATRLVEQAGARIVSADGVSAEDSPDARMFRQMLDVLAEYERSVIRTRTRAALRSRRERGLRFARHAPYGFRWGKTSNDPMEPDPREQATLRRMRTLRTRGLSYRALAERLIEEGHRPRTGRTWHLTLLVKLTRAPSAEVR
jgi:DNA invertase Pin-like site-specific DNA recombinase